ncbi:sensor histidine kinase [Clostridium chromiireducens]|uniref:sensor histidine kinase n=1 Tax=Clostridium chromiireducens TaxID=225345 RepID=UPI003AF72124
MELIIIDVATSVLQSIAMAWTIVYCVDKNKKLDKVKILIISLLFLAISQFYTGTFGDNLASAVFIPHMLALFIIFIFYRKNFFSAVTAYTIIYVIIGIYAIIFGNLIFEYVMRTLPLQYINYEKILIMYIPEWFILFAYFKHLDRIRKIYKFIIYEKFAMVFLVMSLVMDFIITFYLLALSDKSQLIKNIIYIVFFLFFVAVLLYFWKVHQKSQQIYRLNESLELKNSELRKIKHDYGAQISYLYGLCLMERFDDLKRSLKDIINNNESTPTAVEVSRSDNSMLSLVLKPAIETGIHVIIEENCDFSLINMSEMEFYRIVSNIVNNAIKAMKGEGIIIAKSYEYLGNAVIKIENNGPQIPEYHLKDIFKVGFTTKENDDKNHGFGLSIVKDLVESHNGKVYVKSTETSTEFKIILPIVQSA